MKQIKTKSSVEIVTAGAGLIKSGKDNLLVTCINFHSKTPNHLIDEPCNAKISVIQVYNYILWLGISAVKHIAHDVIYIALF